MKVETWEDFWGSLNTFDRRLLRLLQRTHRDLGKNNQMFSYDWMHNKFEIENFVKDRFNVDLNNLPKCQNT